MMIIALCLLLAALGILVTLSIIDLRTWLLPDPLNLSLAITGVFFHIVTKFEILPPQQIIFGALLGAGLLYVIRFCGNLYYKEESLGLGDVKLLGAAGIWLGMEGTIIAIVLGAAAGIVHGILLACTIAMKNKTTPSLKRLALPAGPGFCIGIVLAGLWIIGPYFDVHFLEDWLN